MQIGDIIEWHNNDFGNRVCLTEITNKHQYAIFEEYLISEELDNCLPSIANLKNGLNIYYKYYSKENESQYGVLAIQLKLV